MTSPVAHPIRVVALLTLVAAVLVLLLAGGVGASSPASDVDSHTTYRVVTGDTLWDIAAGHIGPEDDIRRMVFSIRRANGLKGSVIYPGQDLVIPLD